MANSIEKQLLKQWGFRNLQGFINSIHSQISDLEFYGPPIFETFRQKVGSWEDEFLKGKRRRRVAEVIAPPKGLFIKSPDRIAEKVITVWKYYEESKTNKNSNLKAPRYDPTAIPLTVPDILRFRILCNYLSDIDYVSKKLDDYKNSLSELTIEKYDDSDNINIPFNERRDGHRAKSYIFKQINKGRTQFLFEVQVMTLLQHAWDQKSHHLIYEITRIGESDKIPLQLRNRMAAMSELLYVADEVFDGLKKEIEKITGE
jgi:ppGpp synthetase/RelA/SpoT-type nucleotidyltranferase